MVTETEHNEPLATQPQASGGSKNRVLLGCGIGCGLLIFLAIVGGVALYFLGNRALDRMDEMSRPYLEDEYQVWKDQGIITDERAGLYDQLYATVYDEALGSRWVTICVLFLMELHIQDNTITDSEAEQAQRLLTDIQDQPGLGFIYWSEFMQWDEGLQEVSQKLPLLVRDR